MAALALPVMPWDGAAWSVWPGLVQCAAIPSATLCLVYEGSSE